MFCIRFSFIDALEFDRVLFFWDNLRSEDKDNLQRLTGMQHEIQMQTTQNYDNNKQHEIITSTMTATISIDNNITYIYIDIYIITSKTKTFTITITTIITSIQEIQNSSSFILYFANY